MSYTNNAKAAFEMVPLELINDYRIPTKTKFIYIYLISKPTGWQFSAERIADQNADSRGTILKILNELEKLNLLTRHKVATGDNRGRMDYTLNPWSDINIGTVPLGATKNRPNGKVSKQEGSTKMPKSKNCTLENEPPKYKNATVEKCDGGKTVPLSNIEDLDIQKGRETAPSSNEEKEPSAPASNPTPQVEDLIAELDAYCDGFFPEKQKSYRQVFLRKLEAGELDFDPTLEAISELGATGQLPSIGKILTLAQKKKSLRTRTAPERPSTQSKALTPAEVADLLRKNGYDR